MAKPKTPPLPPTNGPTNPNVSANVASNIVPRVAASADPAARRKNPKQPIYGTGGGSRPTSGSGSGSGRPAFGQPVPTQDPSSFKVPHPSDDPLYNLVDAKLVQPFPEPRGGVEPVLTLAEVWGPSGAAKVRAIERAQQIVFHSVGDTGNVKGPRSQEAVADKMVADFSDRNPSDIPAFFFHLGDVVYSFGERQYYYDQFYEPYRDYQAPILAVAGNHDGEVYKGDPEATLVSFLRNFCSPTAVETPDAAGLIRTAMIQPGVFYTFDAPYVRILALYSNCLEDPGVISSEGGTRPILNDTQLDYLTAALTRCKTENYKGAVILVTHHPPFTGGEEHGGSPVMLADIDACCTKAGFWPHAHLSGHAHNYQRLTRTIQGFDIPYIVAGCGGHGLSSMRDINGGTIRTPLVIDPTLTLESYDDTDYGYLRIIVDATSLKIEFHPASDGAGTKSPDDVVTLDLETRTVS
jgi:hypothetical protein